MKILLSHSYFLPLDPKEEANHKPYPPLAPLYLSALIRQETGIQCRFYDVMFEKNVSGLRAEIESYQPDIVLIYDDDFNWLTKMCLQNMRSAIIDLVKNKIPGVIYIAHGSDASDQAEFYLKSGFDYIIHRNAEGIVLQFLQLLKNQKEKISVLKSLSYLENGKTISTKINTAQDWIEKIPVADWKSINLNPYREIWQKHHRFFSLNISTAHGCPYRCNWCAKPLYGRSYKLRPAEIIADEFKIISEKLGADHVWVTDDIFGLNPKWLNQFADEIEKHDRTVPYKIQARADLMDEEYVANLKRSGCEEVWLGAESGSQRILDAMDKDTSIGQIKTAAKLLKNAKIKTAFFLQYGYPGETWTDIKLTLQLVQQCVPDAIGISVSYPLPGTEFYKNVEHELKSKKNWDDSGDLALMYSGEHPAEFYRTLHKYTHHYFGFISLKRKQPFGKFVRRFAAQYRHIPGMIFYRLAMQKYLS
ncbi:MAG: radical SAM protein [Calditrichaeota bacterium]|nr:MAG: radical SAM protein [Calditrichota bacterium]MBL1206661.1 radical SAM protein [Calditrichota bacterium]NOG46488.1 B12-binding domain-containing radical SAM protein [Calditrichota bacterium]